MKIWIMTKKDLAIFFKDRGAWLWLFVLPLVFILIFAGLGSLSLGGSSDGDSTDDRPRLAVVNLDPEGAISKRFLEDFDRAGGYRVVFYDQAEAENALSKYKLSRYLIIPQDFSQLSQGKQVSLILMTHPNAQVFGNQMVLQAITGVARDTSLELQILDGIRQMGEMQPATAGEDQVFDAERVAAQARSQFDQSRTQPLVAISETVPQLPKGVQLPEFDLSQTIVPGMTVLFVFLAAQTVARAIFEERKAGSLRRLLAAPLGRGELLAGKIIPVMILVLIQITFIFTVGALILPLLGFGRLGIGPNLLAWLVTSLIIALCSTCLGLLIASVATTEAQVSGLSNALLWVAGFLGGALVPAFILQGLPVLGFLSRLVPHYWATTAYYDILARGKGLVEILPSLGILLAFSAVFFVVGTRRFRYE